MSAIAALHQIDGGPAHRELLHAMLAAQRVSGPHGESAWLDGPVALGHARFAATAGPDLASSVKSFDGRLHVTADARIDGRTALVEHMRGRGHDPGEAASDEELLLHAYACWGDACVEHLIGDFSFALWDAQRRRLLCAVDPLGAKPLFYSLRGASFCAASGVDAVRLHPAVRDDLDEFVAGDFLLQGCASDRAASIYADIARVPPGHLLVVDSDGARLRQYYAWPEPQELGLGRHAEPVAEFRELLDAAVRDRLRTDRAAIFLSGGLDSSLVACSAKTHLRRSSREHALEGFTGIYERLIDDSERRYAAMVGEGLKLPIDFQALDGGSFFDWIGRVSPAQPMDATVMGPWLGQMERLRARFEVVLTGYDGDALMACTPRMHFRERLRRGDYVRCFADVIRYVVQEHGPPPIGLRTMISRWRTDAVETLPSWFEPSFVRRTQLQERWSEMLREVVSGQPRAPARAQLSGPGWGRLFDCHRPEQLGFALEVVHPLADLRMIRFALELPAVPWCVSKRLLREAANTLPAPVRWRPKTPLAMDPDSARFARGDRVPPAGWRTARLAQFVDLEALDRGLTGPAVPPDLTTRLRAIGLGVWLSQGEHEARIARARPGLAPAQ